jgi:hypothetical protein
MSGRLFRNVAGLMLPADESAADVQPSVPAIGVELQRPIREAECGPETDEEPPLTRTVQGPYGAVTVSHLDALRRLPNVESWARVVEGVDARIWWVQHWDEKHGRLKGMLHEGRDGRPVIYLNRVTIGCPVILGGIVAHESEHWRNGDTRSPLGWTQQAEDRCEEAAERRIGDLIDVVDVQLPASKPTDPNVCRQCYRSDSRTCAQSTDTLARIRQALRFD